MKPLNLDNRPCSPISSNCVIWQGPDIPCIKLCTGDTVSDVIFKLGTELCTIMDQLNVSNYDLSCLNLTACPPEDFQALIQLLITRICELNDIPASETKSSGCPDCVVSVAPCLIQNGQTTMQLVDYVQMIANRLCGIISEIDSINDQISTINSTLVDLQFQIDNLPTYTLPSFEVDCILAGSNPLDVIVQTLMNDNTLGYCALLGATGTPADINAAVLSQCITDIDQPLAALPAVNTFSAYYSGSWVNAVSLGAAPSVSNAINNIWIAVCDMYNYLSNLTSSTTVVAAGEGITVTSATVGTTTTYTVTNDYLETFVANLSIDNDFAPGSGVIPKVLPSSVNGVQEGQVILRYTSVASNGQLVIAGTGTFVPNGSLPPISFGNFNNTTGLFTITDPGMYLIKATIHLKPDNGSTVYWSGTGSTVGDIGSFLIGIHPNNNTDTFVASGQALIPSVDRNVELSTSKVITATDPTTLRVKVLNTTNRDYDGTVYTGADSLSFSIIKLRSGLTITNL
jgi:hypothetical protein